MKVARSISRFSLGTCQEEYNQLLAPDCGKRAILLDYSVDIHGQTFV
jgi:hypothetical protein